MSSERRRQSVHDLSASLALGAAIGWLAALIEGGALAILTDRGPQTLLEWLHSIWIGGILGALLAVLLAALFVLMRSTMGFPESPRRLVAVAVATGLVLAIGGYWFSNWEVVPPLSSLRGALLGGLLALAVVAASLWLFQRSRRFGSSRIDSRATGISYVGTLVLLASIVPLWILPDPLVGPGQQVDLSRRSHGPPMILIMIDTLRRDHLGSYGYDLSTSPNIDSLAQQSILFLSSSSTGNYTLPSTATLFTGLYPSAHGVIGPGHSLPEEVVSLPEIFQAAGYRTAAMVANPLVRADLGFGRGFDDFYPSPPPRWIYHRKTALELIYLRFVRGKIPWSSAADLVPLAIDWLGKSSSQPPFLYLHLIEPHSEYGPPREHALPFLQSEPLSWVGRPPLIDHFRPADEWQTWTEVEEKPLVSDAERRTMIGLYDGEIHYVDYWIGVLLENLESMNLLDDSVIVLMSDHGEEFDDHGGWVHGNTLYEEMVGMPLMIKLPAGEGGGARTHLSVDMVDLRATLAGLAAIEAPESSGVDYSDLMMGPDPESTSVVRYYTERPPHLFSLRVGDWKVIRRDRKGASTWWIYNLVRDPGELEDLSAEHPEQAMALEAALEDAIHIARGSSHQPEADSVKLDPESERVLRALGYIQ